MIRYYAACTLGLEEVLEKELAALGANELERRRGGVEFTGDQALGYKACLWLRSATRVQEELLRRPVRDPRELYDAVSELDWSSFMRVQQTLAVDASVKDSGITHSQYAGLVVKDAIVDQWKNKLGTRPNVDVENPDLPIKLSLRQDAMRLYRELSGESLHKRGYRPIQVKSPLNEATAAGLLLIAGYSGTGVLVDPMCGSGTFLIEAALIALDRAPGLKRRFAFENWPDLDRAAWSGLRSEARSRCKQTITARLFGADRHAGALELARLSAETAGVQDLVSFFQSSAAQFAPPETPTFVIVNPPYGERLGEGADLVASWHELGNFLHKRCAGAEAFVLCGSAELTRNLGLRSAQRWPVMNGPIECRLVRYEVRASV